MKKEVLNELYYEQIILKELPIEKYADREIDKNKIDRLENSNREILKKYPADLMAKSIEKKLHDSENLVKNRFNYKKIYIPLSAAAVFLLFFTIFPVLQKQGYNPGIQDTETVRLKGNKPSLYIYRGNRNDQELLGNNSLVKEKDRLQISYDGAGAKYGVIFSIDGRGTVTLHFPDNVYSNTRLDIGGKIYLPFSYELDNAPFFERFFFVTSDQEIDAQSIMENAGKIAKGNKSEMLNLSDAYSQQSIILFKEEIQ